VAEIGKLSGTADHEFDVTGLVVAPGFIDVHTHAEDVDDQPLAENFLRNGRYDAHPRQLRQLGPEYRRVLSAPRDAMPHPQM
jgi:imidazolonepropionase-like amidohydrolase